MGQEPTPMSRPAASGTPATTTAGAPVPPPVPPPTPPPATTTTYTSDDPQAIRRDIDRTRGEMEGTLTAINDRVNPQRVYSRRKGRMRQRWTSLRNSVMGSSSSSYGDASYDDASYDDGSSWRDRTPDVDAPGRADQAKQAVGERTDQDRQAVSERAEQARQAVSDAPQQVQRQTRGNPLTAGMIAFGIGTLIGSALPESDAERRAARQAAERVDVEGAKQRLTEHAQEVQSGVQDRAREAAEDLKGSARDAAQDVKGQAQQEGQRVKEDARQSGQQVRSQT